MATAERVSYNSLATHVAVVFVFAFGATQVCAQADSVNRTAREVVVRISGTHRVDNGSEPIPFGGAGVVVATTDSGIFIASAKHVFLELQVPAQDSICVQFGFGSDRGCFRAFRVYPPNRDVTLDLVFLYVPRVNGRIGPINAETLRGRLGDVERLVLREPLQTVGCQGGRCWETTAEIPRFEGRDPNEVVFHTTSVDVGDSGGALLNRWGEVIGVVFTFDQIRAHAIRIDVVLDQLCARTATDTLAARNRSSNKSVSYRCGFVNPGLTLPPFPRRGYSTTIDLTALSVTRGAGLPSGRVMLRRQLSDNTSWHVGVARLAPSNISLVAAVAGASYDFRYRRVTVSPFVEGGLGQVDAQYDAGGILVFDNGGQRYVPFWRRLQGSSLGGGAGVDMHVVIAPRTLLNASVGTWRFATPDLSPNLPRVSAGLGLSWAVRPQ
ncbi:MAG: serine protease [Gemmatimonadaceae bacterium]